MATIDQLDIQINATTKDATQSIGKLVSALKHLDTALNSKASANFADQMSKAATAMNKMGKSAANASKGMTEASGAAGKMGSMFGAMPGSVNAFNNAIGRVGKSTRSLASIFGSLYANFFWLRRIFEKGLGAINIAADLTEVQNVVDVTFQDMAYKLDDFAKTSRQAFGLSELSAKTYASQFQAMFSAMGMSEQQVATINARMEKSKVAAYAASKGYKEYASNISDLSMNLTKLAADMGSFFNQQPEDVAKRLQAGVISGQSRALRQYGVDLTMATLQQWALDNGIKGTVQSMTQAEKTMLRYQYVMSQMQMTMGDFSRTSQTWSNQIKLLRQNFQALGAVIGTALIGWIKPVIQAINSAMNTIIELVQAAVNAIGSLMGWRVEIGKVQAQAEDFDIGGAGAADAMEDAAGGAGKAAKNLEDANDEAKKLKHQLMGYDEINLIKLPDEDEEKDATGGGGGGGGNGGAGSSSGTGGFGGVTGGALERFESDIGSWFELGKKIGDAIYDALDSIDWEKIKKKADNFGIYLASFMNGLISPKLFGKLGESLAEALNTVFHALDNFGSHFDWSRFGKSIAAGVNNFFEFFEFDTLAHTLNVWAHGLLDAAITAVERIEWRQIGEKIGKFLSDIDFIGILSKVGKLIWEGLNAGFNLWQGIFDVAPLETALLSLGALTGLLKVSVVTNFLGAFTKLTRQMSNFAAACGGSADAFNQLSGGAKVGVGLFRTVGLSVGELVSSLKSGNGLIKSFGKGFKQMGSGIEQVGKSMSVASRAILGIGAGVAEFVAIKNITKDITAIFKENGKATEDLTKKLAQFAAAVTAAGVALGIAFGSTGIGFLVAGLVAFAAAVVGANEAIDEMNKKTMNLKIGEALTNPGGVLLEDIADNFRKNINNMAGSLDLFNDHMAALDTAKGQVDALVDSIYGIERSMDAGVIKVEEGSKILADKFAELAAAIQLQMGASSDAITSAFGENSVATQAFTYAGVNVQEFTDGALQGFKRVSDEAGTLAQEITEMIASGEFTWDSAEIIERKNRLNELTNTTAGADKAAKEFAQTIKDNPLDWSSFTQGGDVDTKAVMSFLSELAAAAKTNVDTITEEFGRIGEALDTAGTQAEYEKYMSALPEAINSVTNQTAGELKPLTDAVQKSMLEEIPDIIRGAEEAWAEAGGQAATGLSKGEYVEQTLAEYKTNVVDPISLEIEALMSELGLEGEGYASLAMEQMMAGLFSEDVKISARDNFVSVTKVLEEGWEEALSGVSVDSKDYGSEVVKSYNAGIAENAKTTTTEIDKWQQQNVDAVHNSAMRFGSPSLTMIEYGKDTVQGFNDGIYESRETTNDEIGAWLEGVVGAVGEKIKGITDSMLKTVQDGFKKIVEEVKLRMEEMNLTMTEQYTLILETTTLKFEELSMVVTERMDVVKTTIHDGIKEIEGYFANAKLEFPQIKMPHFTIEETAQNFMGQDIIMPKFNVEWYAQGGFPEDGLFFANSHELVGEFTNGRTAVANNEQIIQGIQRGVYYAVRDAMQDSGGLKVDIEANTDGMFRVMQRKSRQFAKSTGATAFG